MEEFKHDSYCGLYCGACDIMSAFRRTLENNSNVKWEDIPLELRKNIPNPKTNPIVCYGCKSDTVFVNCSKCPIRKCARTRMQVESCVQCTKFPCMLFRIHGLIRKLMKKRLPHIMSIPSNQACIKDKGITAWLAEQEEQWKCPRCSTSFSWYSKVCESCNNDLDFKTRFSK